jgi:hypothetical protein
VAAFDNAPLVGGIPVGTMSVADVYPTHSGIGGITTQDRALPAFAEAQSARSARSSNLSDVEGLIGTPAGYLALLLVAVAIGAWRFR